MVNSRRHLVSWMPLIWAHHQFPPFRPTIPPQFLEACSRRAEYFDENGSLLRATDFIPSSLEDILYAIGTVQADDVPCVAAFMRRCLALDPASRLSVQELLNDKWLEDL